MVLLDLAFCCLQLSLFFSFISELYQWFMVLSCTDASNLMGSVVALLSSGLAYFLYSVSHG